MVHTLRRRATGAIVAAALVAAGAAAGCGSDEDGAGTSAKPAPDLAVLLALTGIPFSTATAMGAEEGAKDAGAKVRIAGPPTIDPPTAIKQFSNLIATKPDGAVVFPVPADLWSRPLSEAADRDIKLAAIHVPPTARSKVPLYVGMREKEAASKLASVIASELGRDARGKVVLGIGPAGEPVNENRILGYKETIARELPGVQVVGAIATGNEPVKNLAAWTQLFNRHPDALAFLGTTDQDGSSLAKLKAQRGGDALVGAFDPSVANGAIAAIEDGRMIAAVEQQPWIRGYLATRIVGLAVAEDKPVPEGWLDTGIEVVSKDNVADIKARSGSPAATRQFYRPMIDRLFEKGLDGLPLRPLAEVALDPVGKGS